MASCTKFNTSAFACLSFSARAISTLASRTYRPRPYGLSSQTSLQVQLPSLESASATTSRPSQPTPTISQASTTPVLSQTSSFFFSLKRWASSIKIVWPTTPVPTTRAEYLALLQEEEAQEEAFQYHWERFLSMQDPGMGEAERRFVFKGNVSSISR